MSADYPLLARLFLLELDEPTREVLRDDARFASVLPTSLAEARVEFTRLFTLSVYPYASIFLEPAPEMNGEPAVHAEHFYEAVGFRLKPEWMAGATDALGAELACAAWLLERPGPRAADDFVREQILSWAPVCCLAVERNAQLPFYQTLGRVTHEFLLQEGERIGTTDHQRMEVEKPAAEEMDLRWVSDWLTAPARCGIFLSKDDIRRRCEALELPTAFGDRSWMISNFLQSAGLHDAVPQALEALQRVVTEWIAQYARWVQTYPRSGKLWRLWQQRAENTVEILGGMRAEALNPP